MSVIIPTLNEAGNLPYVLNTIPRWVDEIIIVDGRSSDDTARIARVLRPDARIVHQMRKGKGAALRAGLESANGELLVIMDADGSMDGADIEAFRDALIDGADYVKGSSFCDGGGSTDITQPASSGRRRHLLSHLALLRGSSTPTAPTASRACGRDSLDAIRIDTDGFEVELLIDIRAHRGGLKTAEVPCFETDRIHGRSNLNALSDGLRCLRVILRERLRRYRVPSQ